MDSAHKRAMRYMEKDGGGGIKKEMKNLQNEEVKRKKSEFDDEKALPFKKQATPKFKEGNPIVNPGLRINHYKKLPARYVFFFIKFDALI